MGLSSPTCKEHRRSNQVFEPKLSRHVGEPVSNRIQNIDVEVKASGNSPFNKEPVGKWMAFETGTGSEFRVSTKDDSHVMTEEEVSIAQRTEEWGLSVKKKKDDAGEEDGFYAFPKSPLGEAERTKTLDSSSHGPDMRVSQELKDALSTLQQTFVVSDATKPDCPIVYASSGFFTMTGYSSNEVVGRNCRFLQGPETDWKEIEKIRSALRTGKSYCGRLLNYKKNGTPFWNMLTITPIKDENGNTIKYIGMQVEVSKYTEGVNDKALRPNGLPKSLIKYDARQKEKSLDSMIEVVQTMKHPKSRLSTSQDSSVKNSEERVKGFMLSGQAETLSEQDNEKKSRRSLRLSLIGFSGRFSTNVGQNEKQQIVEPEILMTKEIESPDSFEHAERERDIRQGIDLATTLERIEKNFVISDPRLPDNPIIFASDSFLELTEYTREEILGRNCRFLQGPETDQGTVQKIRDAIREQREITVQLINYTKSGKKFWNLFHLQPMRDQKGELQYFIGVQLDGSELVEPLRNRLSDKTEQESAKLVKATAENVDEAVRELPDANMKPEDFWSLHSLPVFPRPHKKGSASWAAIQKIIASGEKVGLNHFKPVRPLGCGDTGSVHLVELKGTGELYAMKAMDKSILLSRNKVHRAHVEREISALLDHPFLPTLYTSFQTSTHVCLITDFCPGGELFGLLDKQPMKIIKEESARFYAAEVLIALEYLHCLGIVYRDLKPENILLQENGHVLLTDFDLSFKATCKIQVIKHPPPKKRGSRSTPPLTFVAEPTSKSNSFVGTEEYIAPEIITGAGHSTAIDWWALGVLLYEMLYGRTPFRGKNRQKTFANILNKDLTFPSSIPVSLAARQLINGLLNRDPGSRLGSNGGANEIKQHPFFRGIKWPLIRCMSPPPLEVPLKLIGKEANAKEVNWDDEGDLVHHMDFF